VGRGEVGEILPERNRKAEERGGKITISGTAEDFKINPSYARLSP